MLRRHCGRAVGRDFADIEVTTLVNVDRDTGPDDIAATCRALGAVGVQTVMASSTDSEPSKWLEETWGPLMSELSSLGALSIARRWTGNGRGAHSVGVASGDVRDLLLAGGDERHHCP